MINVYYVYIIYLYIYNIPRTNYTKTQKTVPLNVNLNIQFGRVPWVPLIIERIPIRIQIENEYCDYGARWVA